MSISTVKTWHIVCDATGCTSAGRIEEGDWSEWTAERIFNRGQLAAHLRTAGWTIGKFVFCPPCVSSRR